MKNNIIFLCLLIAFFIPVISLACDYCLIGQGISPLETVNGKGIRVTQRYLILDSVYTATKEIDNPEVKEEYWTTEISGFYSLTNNLVFFGVLPIKKTLVNGHLHVHDDGDIEKENIKGGAFGVGDIALLARYTLFQQHTLDTTNRVAVTFGLKFPSGSTGTKTDDNSEFLDSHLQLGTGSIDPLIGLSLSYLHGKLSVLSNLLAAIPTGGEVGNNNHRYGNNLNYNFTTRYRVYPATAAPTTSQFFFSTGFVGELRDREVQNGVELKNSGGHTLYISPGFQLTLPPHWLVELSYQHPIHHNLYGTQIGEDFKIFTGMSYIF